MKFLIIIPAHNEEKCIISCLQSLENQLFEELKIVVVNDGSTDNTKSLLEDFKTKTSLDDFTVLHREKSHHQPGKKVVDAFNFGLNYQKESHKDFDVICKMDADIIFPSDYFYHIGSMFEANPKLGMASGIIKINPSHKTETDIFDFSNEHHIWQFENLSSKNHIRGPIKAYRWECFQEIGGLRPVLGWDNIDVMLAQKNGWEIETNKNLWVKHLRPTAQKYQKDKAIKQGEYFYNIGLSFPLATLSALKSSFKNKSVKQFFQTIKSYVNQKHDLVLTDDEIQFIRKLRWRSLRQKFFN